MSLAVDTGCYQTIVAVQYVIVQRNGLTLLDLGISHHSGIGIHKG